MSETTQRIKEHSSCRAFEQRPVEPALIDEIFECARMSSSSCFLQVSSIIRVTDPEKKKIISEACKQPFVALAPELWIFCGDFHRDGCLCENPSLGWTDHFLVACVDTGIMAQSAMIALESLGLGGVYVGGIRDCVETVHELLKMPANTVPLMGLAFGYPDCRSRLFSWKMPIANRIPKRSKSTMSSWLTTTQAVQVRKDRAAGRNGWKKSSIGKREPICLAI